MTNAVAKTDSRKWVATLEQAMPNIAASLPRHITAEKFGQVARTAIGSTPSLRACMEQNPKAVLTALAQCASDGLLPNNRHAALVPFKQQGQMTLTYIPMIAGVLQRMRNSGEVASVTSRVVYENDQFEVTYGDDERFVHVPCKDGDPGKPIGAYAVIKFRDGAVYREYMSRAEIMKVKAASRAKAGPWTGPFELEMWRKTVLKRAAKYCPFSEDLHTMLDRDNSFYDPEKTIDARPDLREAFRQAPAISYEQARGDGVLDPDEPVRDVADDDGAIDAEVIDESRVDDRAPDGTKPTDAAAPDAPSEAGASKDHSTPKSEDAPAAAPADPSAAPEQADSVKRFYAETMKKLTQAKTADQAHGIMKSVEQSAFWWELTDGQISQLRSASTRFDAKG